MKRPIERSEQMVFKDGRGRFAVCIGVRMVNQAEDLYRAWKTKSRLRDLVLFFAGVQARLSHRLGITKLGERTQLPFAVQLNRSAFNGTYSGLS